MFINQSEITKERQLGKVVVYAMNHGTNKSIPVYRKFNIGHFQCAKRTRHDNRNHNYSFFNETFDLCEDICQIFLKVFISGYQNCQTIFLSSGKSLRVINTPLIQDTVDAIH